LESHLRSFLLLWCFCWRPPIPEGGPFAPFCYKRQRIRSQRVKPLADGPQRVSREAVESPHKLYEGYIAKRNEILARLADVDLESGNQVYSDVRALKVDLTFAIGGVKNHEIYF